ncbi:MAG: RNA polymerase sigma factor RpoD/SigA [Acidobacteriota bacterium]|nr:RNA polymerase sigma factor RpoD/SigA [Acidobacteriota bacterium]
MTFRDFLDSKNLKLYLEQIGQFPTLTDEEEKRLGERARKGDREAQQRLIESNLKFVVSYVKKYRGMGMSLLDMINEGNIGLIEAARRFDPDRNVRFISYAVWWIRQSILHALSRSVRAYHVPQKMSDQISQMKKHAAALKAEKGREPTRDEIAERMGLGVEDIEDLETLDNRGVSLSDKLRNEDLEVGDKIGDEMSPSVEYQIIKSSIEGQIREVLDELDDKEALVIKWRFGMDDDQPRTLQDIGETLGLTRERIRQIEQRAMRKLGRSHRLQQLRGYLN